MARIGLGGRDVANRLKEAAVVEPVQPFEGARSQFLDDPNYHHLRHHECQEVYTSVRRSRTGRRQQKCFKNNGGMIELAVQRQRFQCCRC